MWGSLADQPSKDLALKLVGELELQARDVRILDEPIRFTMTKVHTRR